MEITTLLEYSDRSQLRAWLQENHSKEKECWVVMSRSKTPPAGVLPYIDVVEEALCFGWIDMRCGLMTPAGKRAFENAYGYGYQVFHPTPEQMEQMMKDARERRPGLYENLSPER